MFFSTFYFQSGLYRSADTLSKHRRNLKLVSLFIFTMLEKCVGAVEF